MTWSKALDLRRWKEKVTARGHCRSVKSTTQNETRTQKPNVTSSPAEDRKSCGEVQTIKENTGCYRAQGGCGHGAHVVSYHGAPGLGPHIWSELSLREVSLICTHGDRASMFTTFTHWKWCLCSGVQPPPQQVRWVCILFFP